MYEEKTVPLFLEHTYKKTMVGAPSAGFLQQLACQPAWEREKTTKEIKILWSLNTLSTYKFYPSLEASVNIVCENRFFPNI